MIVNQHPAAIHTAFNPVIVSVTKEGSEPNAIIKIAFGNHDVLPFNFVTKSSEYFNNTALIDLSPILKREFNDSKSVTDRIITDNELFIQYSAFSESGVLLFKAVALNAVSQLGVSSDFTTKRGFFLTDLTKLKKYEGYELVVSCLGFDAGITYILEQGEVIAQTTNPHFSLEVTGSIEIGNSDSDIFIKTNSGETITTNSGDPITINTDDSIQRIINVENECVPVNPFYIRWINQKGGREHWMFTRQITNSNVENIETYNPVVINQELANTASNLLSVRGAEKIQVSAIQLTPNEFKCLSKIPFSPKIEWWNEELQKWMLLIIDKSELSNDSVSVLKSVEFTFRLPELQLQF
jgi:hypothetical protein